MLCAPNLGFVLFLKYTIDILAANEVKCLSGSKKFILHQLEKNWFEEDFILQVDDRDCMRQCASDAVH